MKTFGLSSRRNFLQTSLLTSALYGAQHALVANETRKAEVNQGEAKNVIFMVADGLGHGALALAKNYRQQFEKQELNWTRLYRERPIVRSLVETFSNNSIVTDSAAAASAWGCGQRVDNGVLNMLPDGSMLEPLLPYLKHRNFKTGLVTTATVTHATPAGFTANSEKRNAEVLIAQQYFDRGIDVILGGGLKSFDEELRKKFTAAGYDVALSKSHLEQLNHQQNKPLLGLFSEGHHPLDIDRKNHAPLNAVLPTLASMTEAALSRLSQNDERFFLMVEGARIDHTGHANDAAALIHEVLAFDEAIGSALKFIESHPDTLIIITTDHGTGGPQMNGISASESQPMAPGIYANTNQSFERLQHFKHSYEWMKQQKITQFSGDKFAEHLRKYTGLNFSEDDLKKMQGLKAGQVGETTRSYHGVGWTSVNHTGEMVEFCALGPGSHHFNGFMENREIHSHLKRILGVI